MKQRYVGSALLVLSFGALAQTKVDLGNQSRNIDFSQASFVRPFPIGTALPATCQVGQMFFVTTAPAGANECVSTNIWAPIQGTSGTAAGSIDVERTSSTVLTVGSKCSILTPCLFRVGSSVYSLLAPATVTLGSGSGLAVIYIDSNANLTVGVSTLTTPAVTCSGCIVVGSVTQYPLSTIPLEVWNATNGTWDASGTSNVAVLSVGSTLLAGENIMIAESGGNVTISAGASGSSGGSGGSGSGSGSGSTSGFNPTDPTQFYRDHLALVSGLGGGDGWTYQGSCGFGAGSGATGFSQETILPAPWAQVSGANNSCSFYFPASGGAIYGTGTFDYWSGNTPAQLWVSAIYLSADTNAMHYIGLTTNASTFADFIGCRQTGSGDWFAVIRSGGADVATADTGVAHDSLSHRLVLDNNAGTPNTIRCSVDGGNAATAAGAVPAAPYGWSYTFGAVATGAAAATFAPFQYTIYLQGLPRQ